jgi:hypothetical protein
MHVCLHRCIFTLLQQFYVCVRFLHVCVFSKAYMPVPLFVFAKHARVCGYAISTIASPFCWHI